MIKVIHCADLHLDSHPSSGILDQKSDTLGDFKALIDLTNEKKADILLIAGDLFDTPYPDEKCVFEVLSGLTDCNAEVFICPGNHDAYVSDCVYKKYSFPENVHIFTSPDVQSVTARCGAEVYGYAFVSMSSKRKALPEISDKSRLGLYCIHADLSTSSSYAPISTLDIEMTNADYVALGHVHKRSEIAYSGKVPYAYSGSICARDFGECGKKGAIYAEFYPNESTNGYLSSFEFIPFVKRHYEQITMSVSNIYSNKELIGELESIIMKEGYKKHTSLRVIFIGERQSDVSFFSSMFSPLDERLFEFEYEDKTIRAISLEELENDKTIRGDLYRVLKDRLHSPDVFIQKEARLALRLALTSLNAEDISGLIQAQETDI